MILILQRKKGDSFAVRQRAGMIVERTYMSFMTDYKDNNIHDMTTDIKFMVTKSVVTLQ